MHGRLNSGKNCSHFRVKLPRFNFKNKKMNWFEVFYFQNLVYICTFAVSGLLNLNFEVEVLRELLFFLFLHTYRVEKFVTSATTVLFSFVSQKAISLEFDHFYEW